MTSGPKRPTKRAKAITEPSTGDPTEGANIMVLVLRQALAHGVTA